VITDPSAVCAREKVTRGGPVGTAERAAPTALVSACRVLITGWAVALTAAGCAALHAAVTPMTDRRAAARKARLRRGTVTGLSCRMTVTHA
jgi:hypothetical protein